ncbi:uncharacterized protein N7498_001407 [Penicillium cinerascens]|uniref:AB hydrolase-1 domain-containing protein n=1 Tax=Penicillium cinerascens TaxID=70096 RepID=A0A9W9NIM1_9EURO|nr:uncharacterized protein N7498_001407 [Penicillium cinerascens]KAJ5219308.1 hypothetical protein N7498_001407 [Penicillium cinerascens]
MNFLSCLFRWQKVSFHYCSNSYQILEKQSTSESADRSQKSFADFCKECVPPFCSLSPVLFNGHLQTAWTQFDIEDIPVYYKRKLFDSDDSSYSGQFSVDFVVRPCVDNRVVSQTKPDAELPARTTFFEPQEEIDFISTEDSRPILLVPHGMSGGSHETYIQHALAPLVTHEGGWEACVINSRGCAGSKLTTGLLYKARSTWDFRQVVSWFKEQFPNRPLFGMGFSIGAVMLTNSDMTMRQYLAEEGSNCPLRAAVMVSNPWKLDFASHALQRSWIGSEIYSKILGHNMKNIIKRNKDIITQTLRIDPEAVERINYVQNFDRSEIQCPTWGYPTEDAYYRDASCVDTMLAIRIPFLAIQALDDPIATKDAIPFAEFNKTPFGVLCVTPGGGHLGWFEAGTTNFLNKLAKEVDLDESIKLNKNLDIEPLVKGEASKERLQLFNPQRLQPGNLKLRAKL